MADDGGKADWQEQWKGLIGKLVTASREGIRNASKFAISYVAEAETVVQVRMRTEPPKKPLWSSRATRPAGPAERPPSDSQRTDV